MPVWIYRVLACCVLLLTACPAPEGQGLSPPAQANAVAAAETQPVTTKIATSLLQVVQRMREGGLNTANAATRQAETYSNALVRVDPEGRVHTAIVMTHINEQVIATLATHEVRIERRDDATHSLHAWIPFERLEAVAALSFVRFLRPPHYASRR